MIFDFFISDLLGDAGKSEIINRQSEILPRLFHHAMHVHVDHPPAILGAAAQIVNRRAFFSGDTRGCFEVRFVKGLPAQNFFGARGAHWARRDGAQCNPHIAYFVAIALQPHRNAHDRYRVGLAQPQFVKRAGGGETGDWRLITGY